MIEKWHIEDSESFSELKALLYQDKEPFSMSVNKIITNSAEFTLDEQFKPFLKELNYFDDLIYGKDKTLGITGLEVTDDKMELFYSDGTQETRPMKYWLLSSQMIDVKFKRLGGYLHYRYIRFFDSFDEFSKYASLWNNLKKDVWCNWNPREQAMLLHGITLYKGLKPSEVSVLSFDIESEGLTQHRGSEVFLITNTFEKAGVRVKKHFRLDHFQDSGEMIESWCQWVREIDPDIINGWNIFSYDIPYLAFVAKMRGVELLLGKDSSPIQIKRKPSKKRVDGNTEWDFYKAHVYGRQIIDGLFVALNYGVGKGYPSWGLKPIAEAEGLVKENRQFYDASLIEKNWHIPEEREKIVLYGIDDSDDSINLYYRMITSYFYTNQSLPIPFEEMIQGATGKWVNSVLVRGYLQDGQSIPKASEPKRVAGGMSYGIPGIYSNVLKWDAASYYPSTILKFNIHNAKKDPNNYFVRTVKYFTESRLENKKQFKETGDKYYDDLQAAGKIFINSAYGVLGTSGLNFNSFEHAEEITRNCRAGLQKAVIWATGKDIHHWWADYSEEQDSLDFSEIDQVAPLSFDKMPRHNFQLVNLDTDSLSFCKADQSEFTQKEIESIAEEINQVMYCNWEDDGEFSRVVVLKAKNYILLEKGKTKVKLKGSSIMDSKKEPALTEFMKEVIDSLIFDKNNLVEIYEKYTQEILNMSDISRWAVKKSITKNLLNGTRANETKVLDAIGDLSKVREGDKIYLYNAISGERQVVLKGEPQFFKKTGLPKMETNTFLKLTKDFDVNDIDTVHYLERLSSTFDIFKLVLTTEEFPDYNKKASLLALENRLGIKLRY
jgi:DNA polymerase, archaea type